MTELKINGQTAYVLSEAELTELNGSKLLGLKEIAEFWGIKPNTLSEQRWKIPNFGKGYYRGKKYLLAEVVAWQKRGVKALKETYKSGSY